MRYEDQLEIAAPVDVVWRPTEQTSTVELSGRGAWPLGRLAGTWLLGRLAGARTADAVATESASFERRAEALR